MCSPKARRELSIVAHYLGMVLEWGRGGGAGVQNPGDRRQDLWIGAVCPC